MRVNGVGAYPYDLGIELPEFLVTIPEGASLFGAAGSIVLGVEVEDGLLPAEVAGREPLPTLGYELDVGQLLALRRHDRHVIPFHELVFVADHKSTLRVGLRLALRGSGVARDDLQGVEVGIQLSGDAVQEADGTACKEGCGVTSRIVS